jgi:hypothetical protein
MSESRSYHDVEVEYEGGRFHIFDMPYSWHLTCTRAGGWELWDMWCAEGKLLAGEFNKRKPLRVYVAGVLICGKD